MRRIAWLLALPYVVNVSTHGYIGFGGKVKTYQVLELPGPKFECETSQDQDCQWLYDLAAALNEAHERKTALPPQVNEKGCFKQDCNTCCPSEIMGGYDCTTMTCIHLKGMAGTIGVGSGSDSTPIWKDPKKDKCYVLGSDTCCPVGDGGDLCKPNDPTWKDSKKADWEDGINTDLVPFKPTHVTDNEACGQDDCGNENK